MLIYKWDEDYAKFEALDGMHKVGTPFFNCKPNQLTNGKLGLHARTKKESAVDEGGARCGVIGKRD